MTVLTDALDCFHTFFTYFLQQNHYVKIISNSLNLLSLKQFNSVDTSEEFTYFPDECNSVGEWF